MEKQLQEDLRRAAITALVTLLTSSILDLKAQPVWSNILGALVTLGLSLILRLYRRWPVLIALVVLGALIPSLHPYTIIVAIGHWVVAKHQMTGWALVITALAIPTLAVIAFVVALFLSRDNDPVAAVAAMEPEWKKYRSDTISGAVWRWNWTSYGINDLAAFCPRDHCQHQLVKIDYRNRAYPELICVRCGFGMRTPDDETNWYRVKERIELEIQRRVRTGEYKAALASQAHTGG